MLDASVERHLVIDASALLAFLHREQGGLAVGEMVADPQNSCWIHVVNLCEVYYDLLRRKHQLADMLEIALRASGFKIVPFQAVSWRKAGELKAALRRVSLADCFALTLAFQLKGELVTCDRHELEPIHLAGICRCHFLR